MRRSRRSSTVQRNYTPSVPGKPPTRTTPAQPGIPGSSITQTEEESQVSGNPTPSITGNPQVVLIVLSILFIAVAWKEIPAKLLQIVWDSSGKTSITSLNWGKYTGMIVFIVIAVSISMVNDDIAGIVLMISFAMLAVAIIEGSQGITNFLKWTTSISNK